MSDVDDKVVLGKLLLNLVEANSRVAVEGKHTLEREEIERKNELLEDPGRIGEVLASEVNQEDLDRVQDEVIGELNDLLADNDDEQNDPETVKPGGTA